MQRQLARRVARADLDDEVRPGAAQRGQLAAKRRLAVHGRAQQRTLVGNVLSAGKGEKPDALVRQWLGRDDSALKYTLAMFQDMRNLRHMDYPTLSVAVRRLQHVVATAKSAH